MYSNARIGIVTVLALILGGCAGNPLAQPPNLYTSGQIQPFAGLPASLRTPAVEMLYVTDRLPENPNGNDPAYGFHRSASVGWGVVEVGFAEDVDWPQLAAASTAANRDRSIELSVDRVTELGRLPPTPWPYTMVDDKVIEDPEVSDRYQVQVEEIHRQLEDRLTRAQRKDVLVFIHGFNNSFDDAALTLAQMWHFLGRINVPVLYSWPAGRGGLGGYAYDRESGQFTAFHLKNFIKAIASNTQVERLHLVAHSRGTDVLMTAIKDLTIESLAAGKNPRIQYRIANVVLAAPDMDLEVVTQRIAAERTQFAFGRLTTYTSRRDKALGLSGWLFSSIARVGNLRRANLGENDLKVLQAYDNVDFIDYRGTGDGISHGYFRDSPGVTSDLIKVIRDSAPPGAEYGRPLHHRGGRFWWLDDTYLAHNPGK